MDGAMRTPVFQLQDLLKAFQQNKVLTKEEILQVTQCSTMTAWRLLQRHGYYTSYNCNARYYTLADIPKFDQHGLWNSGKIRFSRWGSLTETVIALVQNSQAGMNAEQLQDLLLVKDLRPALGRLYRQGRLGREKIGGRFVYFPREDASDRRERRRQMESPPVLPLWNRSLRCWSKSFSAPRTHRSNGPDGWRVSRFSSPSKTSWPF
jgi:hypothetical protein